MKYFIILVVTVIAAQALTVEDQWGEFKQSFNRQYRHQLEERARKLIFQDNLNIIEAHNKKYEQGLTTYKMGINKFTDLTREEFQATLTMSKAKKPTSSKTNAVFRMPLDVQVASDVDWRDNGAVTEVKDQGQCGSCWSFSATGSLEGQNFLKTGKLVSLSEQNLMDCSWDYGNMGCNGGLMDSAFDYVKANGIMRETDYPYEENDGNCRFDPSKKVKSIKVSSFTDIPEDDEASLQAAVSKIGPVSVAVDASYFQNYESGVFDDTSCSKYALNHGILAVGFSSENGQDYWVVKNSWGPNWGEQGYIRMARNINQCGIATEASYPILQ